jgi:hypothetical protein
MCERKCRQKCKLPCKVGDLVQFKVDKGVYKTAIVTERYDKRTVFVRYSVGEEAMRIRIIEEYLYSLNKHCAKNV